MWNILEDAERTLKFEMPLRDWYEWLGVERHTFRKVMMGFCNNEQEQQLYSQVMRECYRIVNDTTVKNRINKVWRKLEDVRKG